MNWNSNWDWFGSKGTELSKKPQLMDWKIIDDGGQFSLSAVSSAKSSISASDTSSVRDGMQTPNFMLTSFEAFSVSAGKKMEIQGSEVSATGEPLIGLKLGKRIYFENKVSVMPTPSTALLKKAKSTGQNILTPHCVVQGCNADLSVGKEYHRKHKVCDSHSKCPKVIVGGLERRFCQQCSRFHSLSEFDEKKRSCRKRLADHNARRRKPQRETIQFTSSRLDGERQQLNFLSNNSPIVCSRSSADTSWDTKHNPKFTLTKEYYSKPTQDGGINNPVYLSGFQLPQVINMHSNEQLLASISSIPQVLIPGSKGPMISSSQFDAAPEYCRALSLLSNDDTMDSRNTSYLVHENSSFIVSEPMMNAIPTGLPLLSHDFRPMGHQSSSNPRLHPFVSDQETQLPVTPPYEADLFSNILN